MNRKVVLIILGILAAFCVCLGVVGVVAVGKVGQLVAQTVSSDPVKASEVARSITDYTAPQGFTEKFSMSLMGISLAGISSENNSMFIMFFQVPATSGLNNQQMEEQLRQLGSRQTGQNLTLEKVGTLPAVIHGQATELTILEGTSQKGVAVRELIGAFPGKAGQAMLMIVGPQDGWDDQAVNSLLASMR